LVQNYRRIININNMETNVTKFINRLFEFKAEDTHLQNMIDEVLALIYKTLYKLRFLK